MHMIIKAYLSKVDDLGRDDLGSHGNKGRVPEINCPSWAVSGFTVNLGLGLYWLHYK